MGSKKINKMAIVFFPITIIFYLFYLIYKLIYKYILGKYLGNISVNNIDSIDGINFEELLYQMFKLKGFNVIKTQSSRDYGADLIVNYKGKKLVIQCKLYYKHNVGNSAVQEIASAREFYNADRGAVITNSYFTSPAKTMAEKINIRLIDRDSLSVIFDSSTKRDIAYMLFG